MDIQKTNSISFNSINIDDLSVINIYPGGEWLYYNIYVNQNATDDLIIELIENLKKDDYNLSKPFFFVRYYEEEKQDHLRFRIKVDPDEVGRIINRLYDFFKNNIYIRSVSIDTYRREVTRYGYPMILDVEKLFCIDSKIVYEFLVNSSKVTDLEKIKFCISGIYNYLNCFGFSDERKINFVEIAKTNFFAEFNLDSISKKSLNKAYNQYLKANFSLDDVTQEIGDISLYKERADLCKIVTENKLEKKEDDVVWSIIHMFVNKIFSKKQRFYEMIAYDFLFKLLKTRFHMSGTNLK